MTARLAVEEASFAYGGRTVVDRAVLSAASGELVAVVGPNGAGKTTLLRLCAGLLAPSAGRVRIAGDDPRAVRRADLARRLAFLPQEYSLAFPFTVVEVVLMGRYPYRSALALESAADVAAAEEAMRRCDVHGLADRRFDALSGGERRRALLAQAFCQAPELYLLDEPTAALDPAHALAVFDLLVDATHGRGGAALIVTHDLNLAGRFADRVVVLHDGRVAADGPAMDTLASPAATAAFGLPLHVGKLPGGASFVVPS